MRVNALFVGAIVALSAAGTTAAQTAPDRSAKDIVCALSGDCGGTQLDSSRRLDKPSEAAFSFRATGAGATGSAVKAPAAGAQKFTSPVRAASISQRSSTRGSKAAGASSGLDMLITFDNGSAEMTDRGRINAQEFARALSSPQLQGRRFSVEGHTDAVGARGYNMKLSQDRADTVTAYLKSLGISADRVESKGYGFDRPLPAVPAKASANRRVEIVPLG
jgi:outer membrane protein OmpA-like peptidoglycan-associated protein